MHTKEQALRELRARYQSCRSCSQTTVPGKMVWGHGSPDARVMLIGEAPKRSDEFYGLPFSGASGRLLHHFLRISDIIPSYPDLSKDEAHKQALKDRMSEIYCTNLVLCYPLNIANPKLDRAPSTLEITSCQQRLWEEIYIVDPLVIILAGNVPLHALIPGKFNIHTLVGEALTLSIPGRVLPEVRYTAVPIYHPEYLLSSGDRRENGEMHKTAKIILNIWRRLDDFENLRSTHANH